MRIQDFFPSIPSAVNEESEQITARSTETQQQSTISLGLGGMEDSFEIPSASLFAEPPSGAGDRLQQTAVLNRLSQLTGKSAEELQTLLSKYGLNPAKLPYPPDQNVLSFLMDDAFANQDQAKLMWTLYGWFENNATGLPRNSEQIDSAETVSVLLGLLSPAAEKIHDTVTALSMYNKIAKLTGKPISEVRELFDKYNLNPAHLPQPPDLNVYNFIHDQAFKDIAPSKLLFAIYDWDRQNQKHPIPGLLFTPG